MTDPTPREARASELRTRIVGIRASAGGLEPPEQFLAQLPQDSGLTCVVAQHMDPHHQAMLHELPQCARAMPRRFQRSGVSSSCTGLPMATARAWSARS